MASRSLLLVDQIHLATVQLVTAKRDPMIKTANLQQIERYAEALVPTEYGDLNVVVFREPLTDEMNGRGLSFEHVALVHGDVNGKDHVPLRAHSECLTGEVFHSLKCDCREQLDLALRRVTQTDYGVVLYLRQEGRNIGLGNKIKAYELQSKGIDTVDANRMLGFEDDERSWSTAANMIRALGISSVDLLTNNPAKVDGLRQQGIIVHQRIPVLAEPNDTNRDYLQTKVTRMGHLIAASELRKRKS